MKTKGMAHQIETLADLQRNETFWAIGSEQGTGKTWCLLADMQRKWEEKKIQGAVIFAPKGVHLNWIDREIPKHFDSPYKAYAWNSANTRKETLLQEEMMVIDLKKLFIVAINYDAIKTPRGMGFVTKFMNRRKSLLILDESQKIKNPQSKTFSAALQLGLRAVSKRISSGTLIEDKPEDLWAQFEFLKPEGRLLGQATFRAFKNFYTVLYPKDHPVVIAARNKIRGPQIPQITQRDANGRPMYRNLDILRTRMERFRTRWTKAQCLDLPPKIYQTVLFDLDPQAMKIYKSIKEDKRLNFFELGSSEETRIQTLKELGVLQKLQQVTSGFVLDKTGEAFELSEKNTRVETLMDVLDGVELPCVIWAKFKEEFSILGNRLRKAGYKVAEYHGEVSQKDRELAVNSFQEEKLDILLANASVGSTGLTLTAGRTAIYYSQDFALGKRKQSEDRIHRIGTTKKAVYIDIVARGTVDESIAKSLQQKDEVSELIDQDKLRQKISNKEKNNGL